MSQDEKKPPRGNGEAKQPIQSHLGDQLKRYFSSIVSEPVPNRFANLLDELEKRERGAAKPGPEARE